MSEKRCSLCGALRINGACSLLGCRDPLFDQREEDKIAATEERGRRSGVEGLTDAKALLTEIRHELLRMDGGHGTIAELPANLRRASTVARLSNAIRALDAALAPRDSGKESDFLAAMDEVRDDLKRKGVRVNTVEMLTELYEGRGHSHEEALRMARGEPDSEARK